ncbi:MAG: VOC family protein [Gaiellaceae bacterium]
MPEGMETLTRAATARVVWHDLVTRDAAAVEPFYRDLFGWNLTAPEASGYRHVESDGAMFAGVVERNVESHWLVYVGVDDLDATIKRASELGGRVMLEPMEIAAGRFAMLTDPLGAMFAPFELAEELPVEVTPSTKTFIWDELMTTDAQSALAFYGELFGWESRRVELPDGIDYFLLAENGSEFADVAQLAQLLGRPGWLSYIGVDDVDAIVAEALQLGASIVVEPMELPNVGRFAILADPAGAPFGVRKMSPQ